MAEKKTTQPQQSAAGSKTNNRQKNDASAFNPFLFGLGQNPFLSGPFASAAVAGNPVVEKMTDVAAWTAVMNEQLQRYNAISSEMLAMEKQTMDNAARAIDEIARLSKESLAYSLRMSEQWHKYATEAANTVTATAPKN